MASNINIKVTENVKKELDDLKLESESYNVLLQRLMRENKELRQDKEMLMKIAMKTPDSIAFPQITHSTYFALMQVLKQDNLSNKDKLSHLKSYLQGVLAIDPDEVLKNVYQYQKDFDMGNNTEVLNELVVWITSYYDVK